jgi:transcriptional regulator of acetoin/glycerol metabolism
MTLKEIEREAILAALKKNFGNVLKTCRELRIGRTTLYRRLGEYGIKGVPGRSLTERFSLSKNASKR